MAVVATISSPIFDYTSSSSDDQGYVSIRIPAPEGLDGELIGKITVTATFTWNADGEEAGPVTSWRVAVFQYASDLDMQNAADDTTVALPAGTVKTAVLTADPAQLAGADDVVVVVDTNAPAATSIHSLDEPYPFLVEVVFETIDGPNLAGELDPIRRAFA